jgi:hypothetical protein
LLLLFFFSLFSNFFILYFVTFFSTCLPMKFRLLSLGRAWQWQESRKPRTRERGEGGGGWKRVWDVLGPLQLFLIYPSPYLDFMGRSMMKMSHLKTSQSFSCEIQFFFFKSKLFLVPFG